MSAGKGNVHRQSQNKQKGPVPVFPTATARRRPRIQEIRGGLGTIFPRPCARSSEGLAKGHVSRTGFALRAPLVNGARDIRVMARELVWKACRLRCRFLSLRQRPHPLKRSACHFDTTRTLWVVTTGVPRLVRRSWPLRPGIPVMISCLRQGSFCSPARDTPCSDAQE